MTSSPLARMGAFGSAAMALALALLLGSCSNNVSGPTPVEDPARVTIQPDTAVLYSGLPTTFTVSGGTGTYSISSSNQAVVQVPDFLNGRTFQVIPANVVADTTVTITVRDSGTAPLATAALTVRPGTVANDIVITPTSTQGGDCSPAVCSGGDAIVSATISQGGNPLPARGVRMEVVSGNFRFITNPPTLPEVLETGTTVVTDQAGSAHARIRVLPGAPNQTGIVQVTDLGTGAFRRATFLIAQATGSSPGFFTVPDSITFTGPNDISCASGVRADVLIFGGLPPYTIGNGGTAFSVSTNSVSQSGGGFYVVANGTCAENVPIPVVDSAGRTTTVTVTNEFGANAIPELLVSPSTVTLSECNATAVVTVAGGTGSFTVSSVSGALTVVSDLQRRTLSISRNPNMTATTPLQVGIASGDKVATVTVNLAGAALNTRCDGSALRVTPSTGVDISSCNPVTLVVSGGSGTYSAASSSSLLSATVAGNILTIGRFRPSAAVGGNAQTIRVTVTDGTGTPGLPIDVLVSYLGACT